MTARITMGAAAIAALTVAVVFARVSDTRTGEMSMMDMHAEHMMQAAAQGGAAARTSQRPDDFTPRNPNLPPDNAAAKAQIESSPRHGEWVDIKQASGPALKSWVVYPQRSTKAPVVIVIHEIFGMQDWVRGVADQLAKEGFIAVAPDLLSGKGPNGGGTDTLDSNGVSQAIRTLTTDIVMSQINAVRDYALTIPSGNGKIVTIGFCWGGQQSFAYALTQPALAAAVSYYGPMPTDPAAYGKSPIIGFYGGNDMRVNANIPIATAQLKAHNVTYEPHIFDGAGHGFLRDQAGMNGANMKATEQSWPMAVAWIKKHADM
jgi:carboxymethylenebutenolidase